MKRPATLFLLLTCLIASLTASAQDRNVQNKFALVIGNKSYSPQVGALVNPHNDAKLISDALAEIGFRVVTVRDGDRTAILRETSKLAANLGAAGKDAIGFFYYSGHGVSRPGERTNYLIPIDIRDMDDPDIWWKAVKLDDVMEELRRSAPNASHFLVFDACRTELRVTTRGATRSFAPIARQNGVFIATSTSPDFTATDSPSQASGPYARALALELRKPGQDHVNLFQNVKAEVYATTDNPKQVGWETSGLVHRIYLNSAAGPAPATPALGQQVRPAGPSAPMNVLNRPAAVESPSKVDSLRLAPAVPSQSQFDPQRQITMVVPFLADGIVGATGRLFAEKLAERLKQPVVMENKIGAGGMLGTDYVAKAAPDGHTILMMESSAVLHKWLYQSVPFDAVTDFTPVARVATSPLILIANPSFAPNSVRELIALAKTQPGKLSAGTPGVGTPHHLALLMLNALAKVEIFHVPYRGAALALNDLLAGQIPMSWAGPTEAMPHVTAGKLKALGVTSGRREPALPNIPTIAENDVPGFGLEIFLGIAVPSKTPADVVARLSKEIAEISAQPDTQERIRKFGLTPSYADGETFRAQIRADHERFGKVIREAGIVPK